MTKGWCAHACVEWAALRMLRFMPRSTYAQDDPPPRRHEAHPGVRIRCHAVCRRRVRGRRCSPGGAAGPHAVGRGVPTGRNLVSRRRPASTRRGRQPMPGQGLQPKSAVQNSAAERPQACRRTALGPGPDSPRQRPGAERRVAPGPRRQTPREPIGGGDAGGRSVRGRL